MEKRQLKREVKELREEVRRLNDEVRKKDFNIRQIGNLASGATNPHSILMKKSKSKNAVLTRSERQIKVALGSLNYWLHKGVWPNYKFQLHGWSEWSVHRNDMSGRALMEIGEALPSGWEPSCFWLTYCVPEVTRVFKENRANTTSRLKKIYHGKFCE